MRTVIFLLVTVVFSHTAFGSDLDEYRLKRDNLAQLDVSDLGFDESEFKPDKGLQQTLETRSRMLQQHQLWGLAALAGMGLTLLSGGEGDLPPEHPWVAGITLGLYSVSAYYALEAPDRTMGESKGQVRWHKGLAWVHLPAMVLAPIAGYMAAKKYENGEKLTGLAAQHKNIGGAAAIALALSVASVTFEF